MGRGKGNNVSVRRAVLEKCSGKRRGDRTPQWIPLPRGAVTDSGRGDLPRGLETPPRRADDFSLETGRSSHPVDDSGGSRCPLCLQSLFRPSVP